MLFFFFFSFIYEKVFQERKLLTTSYDLGTYIEKGVIHKWRPQFYRGKAIKLKKIYLQKFFISLWTIWSCYKIDEKTKFTLTKLELFIGFFVQMNLFIDQIWKILYGKGRGWNIRTHITSFMNDPWGDLRWYYDGLLV